MKIITEAEIAQKLLNINIEEGLGQMLGEKIYNNKGLLKGMAAGGLAAAMFADPETADAFKSAIGGTVDNLKDFGHNLMGDNEAPQATAPQATAPQATAPQATAEKFEKLKEGGLRIHKDDKSDQEDIYEKAKNSGPLSKIISKLPQTEAKPQTQFITA